MAIVTERGTFPLSASRNECGRAGDENMLSPQIVFLPLTWPILKEMPAICESARSPSANNNSRETLFRMEIRRAAANTMTLESTRNIFIFEVRLSLALSLSLSPAAETAEIYIAIHIKISHPKKFYFDRSLQRDAVYYINNNYR